MHPLNDPSIQLIFTTAPTGLGHLRVLDALTDGLPARLQWIELGLENFRASKIHALGSRVPFFIKLTEFYQTNKIAERIVSLFYISFLRLHKKEVLTVFKSIADEFPDKKTWVVVCTHFSLAHGIAAAKLKLQDSFNRKIILIQVVTDDSPQRVWAVNGADFIFVPSEYTKRNLTPYLKRPEILKVISFPVSPVLSRMLSQKQINKRTAQVNPAKDTALRIQIPISGAAVQLPFFETLIKNAPIEQFQFQVVGMKGIYTKDFFRKLSRLPHVKTYIGKSNRHTVSLYESLFSKRYKCSIEITKPSEQVFKALFTPKQLGGVILLLTSPIGRQEKDNLLFLQRHKLVPDTDDQVLLAKLFTQTISPSELSLLRYKASHWRAIPLPSQSKTALQFIKILKAYGVFYAMLSYVRDTMAELQGDGVEQFWIEINRSL